MMAVGPERIYVCGPDVEEYDPVYLSPEDGNELEYVRRVELTPSVISALKQLRSALSGSLSETCDVHFGEDIACITALLSAHGKEKQ